MPKASPLDLAAVDPAIWRVYVGETLYGPYTLGQLQGFVEEGRIGKDSLIGQSDSERLVKAGALKELREAFAKLQEEDAPNETPPQTGAVSNYLIATQLARTSDVDLIVCLNSLGKFASVFPGTFILSSRHRLRDVQKALNDAVTLDDQLIIVNATSGRLGWLNIGTDTNIHLKEIWDTTERSDDSDL
ncbi:MAG: hypothetical protein AAF292_00950 [Pseudomonadota bacterium]